MQQLHPEQPIELGGCQLLQGHRGHACRVCLQRQQAVLPAEQPASLEKPADRAAAQMWVVRDILEHAIPVDLRRI